MIWHCMGILSNIFNHPYSWLLLLLATSTLLLYISDRRRKAQMASIQELEALFALRDIRGSRVSRE
jgi:hypothetical protein